MATNANDVTGGVGGAAAPPLAGQPALQPEVTPAPVAVPKPQAPAEVTADDLAAEFGGGDAPAVEPSPVAAEQPGQEEQAAGATDDPPHQGQTAEERIAELTAFRREAERRADAAEAELARLRPPEPAPAETKEEVAPDPNSYPFMEADTQYLADTAAYYARKAVRDELAKNDEKTRYETAIAQLESAKEVRFTEGRAKYNDFDTKVIQGAESGAWPCSPIMAVTMAQSPQGADMAYHFANNVAEAKRVAALPVAEQIFEMGMVAAKFSATTQPVPAKTTAAPPPPRHVARGEGGQYAVPDDTDDFAAFEAKVDAKLAASRR